MQQYCFMCTQRFSRCHCGDYRVTMRFGREVINPNWHDKAAVEMHKSPHKGLKRERRNGPVTITKLKRVRIGTKITEAEVEVV